MKKCGFFGGSIPQSFVEVAKWFVSSLAQSSAKTERLSSDSSGSAHFVPFWLAFYAFLSCFQAS